MTIIFARTRYEYDSYTDFWKLVELSGFPIVYVDEMDHGSKNTYIASPFNGEFFGIPKKRNSTIYMWNLERPGNSSVLDYRRSNEEHIAAGLIDKVIVSDMTLSKETGFVYVPLGSHAGLGEPGTDKVYDFIHLMCYSLRRAEFFDYLTPKEVYYGMKIAPNGWGEERHKALQQSKYMLSIHQDRHPYIEPLRFAIAAAYGLPIVSESTIDGSMHIYEIGSFSLIEREKYSTSMRQILNMYDGYGKRSGERLHTMLTQTFTFRRCLEKFI